MTEDIWAGMAEENRGVESQYLGCGKVGEHWRRGTGPLSPTEVTELSHCWYRRDGPIREKRQKLKYNLKINSLYASCTYIFNHI